MRGNRAGGIRERRLRPVPAFVVFVPVVALAAAQGGFFPTAWGWASVPLLWTAAVALVVRERVRLGRPEILFLAGLAALTAWIALSAVWSPSASVSLVETERALVYVGACGALLLTARGWSARPVLGALLAAIASIAAFSLATRLLPDRVGVFDPTAVYRLAQPIGYWNGLALFVVIGVLLATGFAARAHTLAARAAAALTIVPLLATLYFTFGRAAWIALGAGLLAALAVDQRRVQLLAALLALAPAGVAGVLLASRQTGLTRGGSSLESAARDGHRLAIVLVLLAAAEAAIAALVGVAERRLEIGAGRRRAFAISVAVVAAATAVGALVHFGGPVAVAKNAYASFKTPLPPVERNLNARLLSFSGNGRAQLWGIGWDQARGHALLGAGAGAYERYLLLHKPRDVSLVRDAHSLYVETLAELGPIGWALLVLALATPLVAIRRARAHPLAAPAVGAYVAYLVHTGVDWDWELPAVTLAGLACGAAILIMARRQAPLTLGSGTRWASAAVLVVAALLATTAVIGNTELSRSASARQDGSLAAAATDARRARTLMPWSPSPWEALGRAQLQAGLVDDARTSFRRAIGIDGGDWNLWYELSRVTTGTERSHALGRVAELFPRSGLVAVPRSAP